MPRVPAASLIAIATVIGSAPVNDVHAQPGFSLGPMVVTPGRRAEPQSQVAATVQVIDEERIRASGAQSVTDLLAEHAVGFFSEWTPAQTSMNIRGGASDGQGRDFRGQVNVLLNGRRAGTANLSKLSLNDVRRIEIVRGPASVAYGSQAMGGVVNIITRTGADTPTTGFTARTGSWNLREGHVFTGGALDGIDYYLSGNLALQNDYESGRGSEERMVNTAWERRGGLASLGGDLPNGHRLELTARSDGVYDAGFRGSAWNFENTDNRINRSLDLVYDGFSEDGRLGWNVHGYLVRDIDEFNWANPRLDWETFYNERILDIQGLRLLGDVALRPSTDLRAGIDWEYSELRNDRLVLTGDGEQVGGPPAAPQDNDHDERVVGLWTEGLQRVWDDRVTLRAGARYTDGRTSIRPTVGRDDLRSNTERYDEWTYSLGAAWRIDPRFTGRIGYATGFRAPTATELAADFAVLAGGQVIGNPNLDPERSEQVEVGVSGYLPATFVDLALFRNVISDRIVTEPLDDDRRRYANSDDPVEMVGLELQSEIDLAALIDIDALWRLQANGTYHFRMRDRAAPSAANTDRAQRIHKYQAGLSMVVGEPARWDVRLTGILRGPVWYRTEERLLIPEAEPSREFVHKKNAFWVLNLRGSIAVTRNVRVFAGINNLLDKNEHPLFIALNETPYISDPEFSNGGRGNSMPGRMWFAGVSAEF